MPKTHEKTSRKPVLPLLFAPPSRKEPHRVRNSCRLPNPIRYNRRNLSQPYPKASLRYHSFYIFHGIYFHKTKSILSTRFIGSVRCSEAIFGMFLLHPSQHPPPAGTKLCNRMFSVKNPRTYSLRHSLFDIVLAYHKDFMLSIGSGR